MYTPSDSTATSQEVDLPVEEAHPKVENLAGNKELVDKIRAFASSKYQQFSADRSDLEASWNDADFMWTCGQNAGTRATAQTSKTRANTASTLFYRQVRAIASQILTVLNSKPDPYKYEPVQNEENIWTAEEGRAMAGQLNALARWTRKADGFDLKAIELIFSLVKYSNLPISTYWRYRSAERMTRVPIRIPMQDRMEVVGYDFDTMRKVIENWPSMKAILNENFYCDRGIGDMQKQACIIIKSLTTKAELWAEQRDGNYMDVDKITDADMYRGEQDTDAHAQKQENRGLSSGNDWQTDQYQEWHVWGQMPIADGKWDEKSHEPKRYCAVFVGTDIASGKCVKVARNYDPDDEYPFAMLHLLPDDEDLMYHVGLHQLLKSSWNEQTTKKNQALDNDTLINKRPLKKVRGEVYTKDVSYEQSKVIEVERPESLTEMDVAKTAADTIGMLQYLDDDSNQAAGTTSPVLGNAMGGRTSASEAQNAFNQAMTPLMILSRYVLTQWLGWYGRKGRRYWEIYGDDVTIKEITGEGQIMEIKPAYIFGEYDVELNMIDEFETNAVMRQADQYVVAQILPMAPPNFKKDEFMKDALLRMGYKNTAKYFNDLKPFDAERVARLENITMIEGGKYVEPSADEDMETHLRVHEMAEQEYAAVGDKVPQLQLLTQHIAMTRMLKQQADQARMMQAPPPGPPQNQSVGEVSGNEIAAQMGGPGQAMGP